MARVNVYLPDELAEQAKAEGLNISGLTQDAVRNALTVSRTDEWLDDILQSSPTGVTHQDVAAAVLGAKEEFADTDA